MTKKEKQMMTGLAQNVLFALKFMRISSGSGMMMRDGKTKTWQNEFMDSLDAVGYEIDRDAYWKMKEKKK